MNRNAHPKWHGDGTRAPSMQKEDEVATGICGCCTAQAVPLRATNDRINPRRSAESCGSGRGVRSSGTTVRQRPFESMGGHHEQQQTRELGEPAQAPVWPMASSLPGSQRTGLMSIKMARVRSREADTRTGNSRFSSRGAPELLGWLRCQPAGSRREHRHDRTVVGPSAALLSSDESGLDELLHVV